MTSENILLRIEAANLLGALRSGDFTNVGEITSNLLLTEVRSGYTPIHVAARDGYLNRIPAELLTAENLLSVVHGSGYSSTPLSVAARNGNLCQVPTSVLTAENLLNSSVCRSALDEAALFGFLDQVPRDVLTVENLLAKNSAGNTPLGLVMASDVSSLDALLGIDFASSEHSQVVRDIVGELWWSKNQAIVAEKKQVGSTDFDAESSLDLF